MFEKLYYSFDAIKSKIFNLIIVMRWECLKEKNLKKIDKPKLAFLLLKKILKRPNRIFNVLCGKEVHIPYIEMVVTTVCNLKCQGCSALMNYYDNPKHIDINENIRALKRLTDSVDSINTLRILGGEPMCYPYLYEMIKYISKQDKIKKAVIVTNGTFCIINNKLLELLKKDKFYFSISDYGDASKNYNKLIEQLKENNINYIPMKKEYVWIDYGDFKDRNRSDKSLRKQFIKCTHRKKSLINGKIFQCFRCSHATNLNLIPLKDKDYINLFDNNITKEELKEKIYKFIYKHTDYIESCKFCDCTKTPKNIVRGVQNKKNN